MPTGICDACKRPWSDHSDQGCKYYSPPQPMVRPVRPVFKLQIPGPPRTKKNDLRRSASGGVYHARGYTDWERSAAMLVSSQWAQVRPDFNNDTNNKPDWLDSRGRIQSPTNLGARVWKPKAIRSDLLNYLAAVSDVLQRACVIRDDCLFTKLDGCELLLDRQNPRVEITLTVLQAAKPA